MQSARGSLFSVLHIILLLLSSHHFLAFLMYIYYMSLATKERHHYIDERRRASATANIKIICVCAENHKEIEGNGMVPVMMASSMMRNGQAQNGNNFLKSIYGSSAMFLGLW